MAMANTVEMLYPDPKGDRICRSPRFRELADPPDLPDRSTGMPAGFLGGARKATLPECSSRARWQNVTLGFSSPENDLPRAKGTGCLDRTR